MGDKNSLTDIARQVLAQEVRRRHLIEEKAELSACEINEVHTEDRNHLLGRHRISPFTIIKALYLLGLLAIARSSLLTRYPATVAILLLLGTLTLLAIVIRMPADRGSR